MSDPCKTMAWSVLWLMAAGLGLAVAERSVAAGPTAHPNIVLIFMDDMGYNDVGCYGAQGYTTPNLDRLASQGIRFTDFYVSQAVCSASRAGLMTGCYNVRVGIFGALGPRSRIGLNPDETTIAEMLKPLGYATAIFGKWHLGHLKPFLPLQQGFDEYFGLPYSNDMWPMHPRFAKFPLKVALRKGGYPPLPLIEGNRPVQIIKDLHDQDTLTTRYTEHAVRFIEKNKDRPFFLYLPHSMPHVPLGVSDKFRGKSERGLYGDVIMEIDWSVGQIMQTLDKLHLTDKTLVVFTSDNGPWLNYGNHAGSAFPLREGKGTMWDGGCREPCIMRWPGVIAPGSVCKKMAATIDLLPTFAAITGAALPKRKIDGVNLLPLLQGRQGANPRNEYYFYYGHQLQAVRRGPWKLHFPHYYRSYEGVRPGRDGQPGPTARGRTGYQLYNLGQDIRELENVADLHPDIVEQLKQLGDQVRLELGDVNRKGRAVRDCGHADIDTDAMWQ